MNWAGRDYNGGLMSLLMQMFDQHDEFKRIVGTRDKRREYIIKNPFLSIATCTTIEWLKHVTSNIFFIVRNGNCTQSDR